MSWDLIILVVLIVAVVLFFRKFSSFIYFIASLDILLRILTFIKNNIGLPDVSALIHKYIPESLGAIINKYTAGVFNTILWWIYCFFFIIFLFYTVRILWKKK